MLKSINTAMNHNHSITIELDLYRECLDKSYLKPLYNEVFACIVLLFILSILFLVKLLRAHIVNLFSPNDLPNLRDINYSQGAY
jgi:hypothetical protein